MNASRGIARDADASPEPAFKAVLISPYELGRQSFNLAAPAALLKAAGFEVVCVDLALQKLDPDTLHGARWGIRDAMPTLAWTRCSRTYRLPPCERKARRAWQRSARSGGSRTPPPAAQRRVSTARIPACPFSGPVHAEMRVNDRGIWLLEVAARSIGGLCGRALNHRLGISLEELILRHALDMPAPLSASDDASGVMMIPVPARGIFHHAAGLMAARAVPGVSDIRITAQPGQIVAPPPEGTGYLGFILARTVAPEAIEAALRAAHANLAIEIQAELPMTRACAELYPDRR